jgi:acetyl-CoA carboxylase biotin carboxyl carrier protein
MKSEPIMKKLQGKIAAAPGEPFTGGVDLSIVAALAKIAGHHDLSEVEIEHDGLRVRVARERRAAAPVAYSLAAAPPAPGTALETEPAAVAPANRPGSVKSPMVGTAYLRASPEAKPFVEVGSMVKAGDKILLVEAMKTFNEIVAPNAGKVVEILVEDGSPVEYGQTVMIIE